MELSGRLSSSNTAHAPNSVLRLPMDISRAGYQTWTDYGTFVMGIEIGEEGGVSLGAFAVVLNMPAHFTVMST